MAVKRSVAEILAQALVDANIAVIGYVPGAGATEVYTEYSKLARRAPHVSFHEEVAYGVAFGAAISGRRAAVLLKSHGLAKAADAAIASLSVGTTAACVVVVADDKLGKRSDTIFDCAAMVRGLGMPFIVLRRDRVYQDVAKAVHQSERLRLPVALIVDADECSKLVTPKSAKFPVAVPRYERDVFQHVVCPAFAPYQLKVLQAKRQKKPWGSIKPPVQPIVPHSIAEHYKPAAKQYIALFSVFRDVRGELVLGDVGVSSVFAFRPYECIDVCAYMGGSIPLAVGALAGGMKNVWAVTGDFSFVAAGALGLLEATQRGLPLKVLVCFNGTAAATGGQPVTPLALHRTVAAYAGNVRFITTPQDRGEIRSVLTEAAAAKDLRIVVTNYT